MSRRLTETEDTNLFNRALSRLTDDIFNLIETFDQKHSLTSLFFACLAVLLILSFPILWAGGEEHYFAIAHRRIDPDNFSTLHAAFDYANSRFLGEYFIGAFIWLFGIDLGHAIAKFVVSTIYAAGLALFFRSFHLSAFAAIAVIAIFCMAGQSLIGGEVIFGSIEPKTLAYAGVFAALGLAFQRQWYPAIVACVVATYFHFLVGGPWAAAIIALRFFQERNINKAATLFLFYSLLVLPLVIIIAIDQFGQAPPPADVNLAKLYAIRNAHHIAPFLDLKHFVDWIPGILRTGTWLLVILLLRACKDDKLLANFAAVLLAYLLVALLVSFLDRNTFYLAKFYLFRPSSLIFLLCIALVIQTVSASIQDNSQKLFRLILSGVIVYFVSTALIRDLRDVYKLHTAKDWTELVSQVKKNSKPDEVLLIDEPTSVRSNPLSIYRLHRLTFNPTLVSWKFVPSNPRGLYEWQKRIRFQTEVFSKGCSKALVYPVKLLLFFDETKIETLRSCGQVVYRGDGIFLLALDEKWRPR